MAKSRFFYLHPDTNEGKLAALDVLQKAYASYLQSCVDTMVDNQRPSVDLRDQASFFAGSDVLPSSIAEKAQQHAVAVVSGWTSSKYTTRLRSHIKKLGNEGVISEDLRSQLYIIGKCGVDKPNKRISQEAIDLYWSWLRDPKIAGRAPQVSCRTGMMMGKGTGVLTQAKGTKLVSWWLAVSHHLKKGRRIKLPLKSNPHIEKAAQASKGIFARKTKSGVWRFEVLDGAAKTIPKLPETSPAVGVDVGLNVMAATSSGLILGAELKPKFDRLYTQIKEVRANRQRQGLKTNSIRLDRMESRLTGLVKTLAGECANKLVKAYPGHRFVIEDLDLRGCRGQKRFAYKALHNSLKSKATTVVVNPAYSSQTCPSCEYLSRNNRSGIKFTCHSCGRSAHADYVGGSNLLRRSEDKQIGPEDHTSVVRAILRERYRTRRDSSAGGCTSEPPPSGRELTTGISKESGTALNQRKGES